MNVPKLRFSEFTGEWEDKKLGEIVTMMQSGLSRKLEVKDVGLPVLRSNNLVDDKLDLSDIRYWFDIDDKGANLENYFLKNGDLLVNFINSIKQIGKTAIYNGELQRNAIFTTNIMRLNFNSNTEVFFIHNLFQTKKYFDYIQSITKPAVNQASFTTVDFKRFKLCIPSLTEQHKIASFLSKVDSKIDLLMKKQELWETYKKGIMQQIFSQKLRFKDENGEDYPDWVDKKLGEVSDVRDGTHDSPKYISEGYPLVTSKNLLKTGKIEFENVNYISKFDYDNINKRSKVHIGDILFGMIGTIGNPVLVESEGFAIKNVALIKENDILKNSYLFYLLKSPIIDKQFYRLNAGGTQKFVALGLIRNLNVPVPTLSEQNKIANFLSSFDNKKAYLNRELKINIEFKKGLLQQMFC